MPIYHGRRGIAVRKSASECECSAVRVVTRKMLKMLKVCATLQGKKLISGEVGSEGCVRRPHPFAGSIR